MREPSEFRSHIGRIRLIEKRMFDPWSSDAHCNSLQHILNRISFATLSAPLACPILTRIIVPTADCRACENNLLLLRHVLLEATLSLFDARLQIVVLPEQYFAQHIQARPMLGRHVACTMSVVHLWT